MIRALALAAVLVATSAAAQIPNVSRLARGTVLSPLPDDATPADYWAGAFMDQTNNCARFTVDGQNWLPCTATVTQVQAVQDDADAAMSAANVAIADAASAASDAASAQSTATSAASAASSAASAASAAQSTANAASTTASNAASAASAAQTTATNAATAAGTAQTTANAAQSAASTNATAIAALQTTVAGISRRACGNASISGVSIPLLGISSTTSVAVSGAPVGTSCDVGLPSFLPLGAKPVAAVLTAGTASLRFEGNSALLSAIIAIPNGTYRVCCDL